MTRATVIVRRVTRRLPEPVVLPVAARRGARLVGGARLLDLRANSPAAVSMMHSPLTPSPFPGACLPTAGTPQTASRRGGVRRRDTLNVSGTTACLRGADGVTCPDHRAPINGGTAYGLVPSATHMYGRYWSGEGLHSLVSHEPVGWGAATSHCRDWPAHGWRCASATSIGLPARFAFISGTEGGESSMPRTTAHTVATIHAIGDAYRGARLVFLRDGVVDAEEMEVLRVFRAAQALALRADWNRRARQSIENSGAINPRLQQELREMDDEFPLDAA